MTARTLAHNLVLIDKQEQQTKERGGEVDFFLTDRHVKAMRASSRAYPGASLYRRTSAVIDHGQGRTYVVDFFAVRGGTTQDYVFHGPTTAFTCDRKLQADSSPIYDLKNVRSGAGAGVYRLLWQIDEKTDFTAWCVGQDGEKLIVGDGWGQRDYRNSDIGATLPYVVRRCQGAEERNFISLFEGHARGKAFVKTATLLGQNVLAIDTDLGRDYIFDSPGAADTMDGRFESTSPFAVISVGDGRVRWTFQGPR
jgi:hypothetical protein